ncbi:MAG: bifunctional oligoribonuclease/PAP phosphatase NrnA [Anaerovoracaceae bacterium]
MTNNSFIEISNELKKAKHVYIFPHISMDGDAVGSGVALASALRYLGISCNIVVEDNMPENLKFMEGDFFIDYIFADKKEFTSVCVDCSDYGRFPLRGNLFDLGKTKICIDHHMTADPKFDLNYIDQHAAATAEIIYDLINVMEVPITKDIADAIFLGITTDSGNFQYSNTTKKTHLIAADLADKGADFNKISVAFYENETIEKVKLTGEIMSSILLFANNKAAFGIVTQNLLKKCNAKMEYSEGTVANIRAIKDVEIAGLFKEVEPKKIKISLRAKGDTDVAQIAEKHNGGGHKKAAGCTIFGTMDEAIEIIKKEVEESFAE